MSKQYDILYIQQYLNGDLSSKDMHQLEVDALEDAMLQDAIDGFSLSKGINHKQLSLLQQRLEDRIEAQKIEKNIFYFTGQRLAIASVAGVMVIVFGVLFWMMSSQSVSTTKDLQKGMIVHLQDKAHVSLVKGSMVPKEGWNNFEDYLTANGTGIAEGEKVRLYFEVNENRPQNIKILSSSNKQVANKLIELLKTGPSWQGEAGEFTVSF